MTRLKRAALRRRSDEAGVTLVLALVSTVAVSVALLGLADLTTNDILNSGNLRSQHNIEYAADGATTMAIQSVRYSGLAYIAAAGTNPGPCLPGGTVTLDGVSMGVTCVGQQYDRFSGVSRVIDFYACATGACTASNAVLQAEATFDDLDSQGTDSCRPPTLSSCGAGQTLNSWVVRTGSN